MIFNMKKIGCRGLYLIDEQECFDAYSFYNYDDSRSNLVQDPELTIELLNEIKRK